LIVVITDVAPTVDAACTTPAICVGLSLPVIIPAAFNPDCAMDIEDFAMAICVDDDAIVVAFDAPNVPVVIVLNDLVVDPPAAVTKLVTISLPGLITPTVSAIFEEIAADPGSKLAAPLFCTEFCATKESENGLPTDGTVALIAGVVPISGNADDILFNDITDDVGCSYTASFGDTRISTPLPLPIQGW
jgi:hypothetical protein